MIYLLFLNFLTFCKPTANILIRVTINELINKNNHMTNYRNASFTLASVRNHLNWLIRKICTRVWIKTAVSSGWCLLCGLYGVFFLPLSFSILFLLKWTAEIGLLLTQWWYFDFTFPFPVYHILIRSPPAVTYCIQLHLLKHTQMLLSIWNMVRRLRKTSVFTVRKSNLASGASYYLSPLGKKM